MAFVTRSSRNTLGLERSTPSQVGPGAYNVSFENSSKPSYAPFASSSERQVGLGGDPIAGFTPGPGEYVMPSSVKSRKGAASSSMFASRSNRDADSSKVFTNRNPGPGSYKENSQWIKPSFRKPRNQKKKSSQQVQWVRVSSAPSIPTTLQSYGYEESSSGDLVLQAPPSQGYWGSKNDSAGPGSYNPQKAPQNTSGGTGWARSKVHRDQPGEKISGVTGGPGVYNTDHLFATAKPIKSNKPSSVFMSKVDRSKDSSTKSRALAPGPGQYDIAHISDFNKVTNNHVSEHFQFFGSKASRSKDFEGNGSVPGPGEYNAPSSFKGVVDTDLTDDLGKAFSTSSVRFSEGKSVAMPGPGQYENNPNISHDLSRKIFGRNASFGTTSSRFSVSAEYLERKKVPGPGAYTEKKLLKENRPQSVFASSTRRFKPKKSANNPAPGAYEQASNLVSEAYKLRPSTAFVSTSTRSSFKGLNPAVGPGSYNIKGTVGGVKEGVRTHGVPRPTSTFASGKARFSDRVRHQTPSDIGPGAYETAGGPLIKRSYNITVGALS
mmetsp:Transcript_689/g.918  ORF Transcript_689/g.918 Transcript_689/m.918 type:complete len:549 (+) Transcript_689:27-1673(+)